ncbi:MAG: exodeoxyribonuclease VII large subunit, partial [Chloroflexi bacterium]|nr:exodeoxyribonuclease VII large subunit [Chloroflexota bacterium]
MAVYTVAQVTAYLKDSLDRDAFLADLWVSGEVSNLSRSSTGNLYFTLKDAQSQMRCVMFRPNRGGELLANGDAVVVHGRVSLYPARGEVQVYVDLVQPEGTGELYLELERLKARLEDEGLFEPTRKRPLPPFPRKLGVVTSPTGAVFHDICNVLQRRYPLVEVVLSPTPVQGDSAAQQIVAALRALNDLGDIDVIIIARGGGSLEELWPFNDEVVARAIYASRVPVITGIGHETDTTIADLVADRRAPTPSAAAEIAVPDAARLQSQIAALQRDAVNQIRHLIAQRQQDFDGWHQRLLSRGPQVPVWRQSVDELAQALARGLAASIVLARERFAGLEQRLASLNPQAVLGRGYALVQRAGDGGLVISASQVRPDDPLKVTVSDGSFGARVV